MSKFISAPDLWDVEVCERIKTGELRLQTGQWVKCGDGKKSRFINYNKESDTFNVVHYPVTIRRFRIRVGAFKLSNDNTLSSNERRNNLKNLLAI